MIKFLELHIRNFYSYGNNITIIPLSFTEPTLIIGENHEVMIDGEFDANAVMDALEGMDLPSLELFATQPTEIGIHIPGGVGDIIKDPDGGVWIHAERISSKVEHDAKLQPVTIQALAVSA